MSDIIGLRLEPIEELGRALSSIGSGVTILEREWLGYSPPYRDPPEQVPVTDQEKLASWAEMACELGEHIHAIAYAIRDAKGVNKRLGGR